MSGIKKPDEANYIQSISRENLHNVHRKVKSRASARIRIEEWTECDRRSHEWQ